MGVRHLRSWRTPVGPRASPLLGVSCTGKKNKETTLKQGENNSKTQFTLARGPPALAATAFACVRNSYC